MDWKHKNLVGLTVESETTFTHPTVEGLRLRAYPNGRKTWQWARTFDKRSFKKALGRFPAITLFVAEATAREWNETLERGGDPLAVPEAEAEPTISRMTVEEGWTRYTEDCARRGKRSNATGGTRVWNIGGWRYKTGVECVLPLAKTSAAIFNRRAEAGKFIVPPHRPRGTGS